MRLFVLAAMVAGCASLAACSFMEPSAGPAARWAAIEKARKAKANPNPQVASAEGEMICKTMTPTGTIMPKKVCSTEAEWDAFDAETAKTADKFNELRRSGSMEPGKEGAQFKRN
jgi:hypothetical protein